MAVSAWKLKEAIVNMVRHRAKRREALKFLGLEIFAKNNDLWVEKNI